MPDPTTPALVPADAARLDKFRRDLSNPLKLKLFMLRKLPMAYLAGLRVAEVQPDRCTVTVPYKYLTQNPFKSIYFACLSMAAEMASGLLAMMHVQAGSPVSMLVVGLEADFTKKAVGLIRFTCPDGAAIGRAVAESRATGEGRTVLATSTGLDEAGNTVAIFRITWSFRGKR